MGKNKKKNPSAPKPAAVNPPALPKAVEQAVGADPGNHELLLEIAKNTRIAAENSKRQVVLSGIRMVISIVLAAAMVLFALNWSAKAAQSLQKVNHLLDEMESITEQLEEADIAELVKNVEKLAEEGIVSMQSIREAAETLGDLNMDKLNQAISDLQTAISPLARLFG